MEIKKSKKANLETRRPTNLLIGLVVGLAFVWMAFEHKSYDSQSQYDFAQSGTIEDEEIIIQTERLKEVKIPEVKPVNVFREVDNEIIVPDIIFDIETDDDDDIEPQFTMLDDDDDIEPTIFVFVEEDPSFPGGDEALLRYLSGTKYPRMAVESEIQGTVHTTFVVEPDGRITNVALLRGIGGGCDEEALRMIREMPNWKPGKQRGKNVRVQFKVPIRFVLQGN